MEQVGVGEEPEPLDIQAPASPSLNSGPVGAGKETAQQMAQREPWRWGLFKARGLFYDLRRGARQLLAERKQGFFLLASPLPGQGPALEEAVLAELIVDD